MTGISGGGAAASSSLTFHDMSCMEVESNYLFLHISTNGYGFGSSTTSWERFDRMGAYVSNASMTADTYYTLVNITGAGYLGNIITNTLGTGTATLTTKVTIDGVAIERAIDTYGNNTTRHLVFGPVGRAARSDGEAATYSNLLRGYNYSPWDGFGSGDYTVDNYQNTPGYQSIIPCDVMLCLGLPVIPFKTDLKVEIKQSATGPNHYYNQRAGVSYIRTD